MEAYKALTVVIAIFLGFPVYFLPAYLAARREHPARRSILYWNLFAGWTVFGWAFLMLWAAKEKAE